MPSVTGNVPEEHEEFIRDMMDGEGKSMSEALAFCIAYTSEHKYGDSL